MVHNKRYIGARIYEELVAEGSRGSLKTLYNYFTRPNPVCGAEGSPKHRKLHHTLFHQGCFSCQSFILKRVRGKNNEKKVADPDPKFLVDLPFHDLRHKTTSRFFEKG